MTVVRSILAGIIFIFLTPWTLGQSPFEGGASFEGLGSLEGGNGASSALGVSADGNFVVGVSNSEAFLWSEGEMIGLGFLGSLPGGEEISRAFGVSADGSVIVGMSSTSSTFRAFRWTQDGGMLDLGSLPGGNSSTAQGVSADGSVVVGRSATSDLDEAYRWTANEGMVGLGALPGGPDYSGAYAVSADGSVIVGSSVSSNGREAFRWENGEMEGLGRLPSCPFSDGRDVSSDGAVVVGSTSGIYPDDCASEGFRWEDGNMGALGSAAMGNRSQSHATSADGSVIVGAATYAGDYSPAIWTPSYGMRYLRDLLENDYNVDLSGWYLSSVNDISDDGTVFVGTGRHNGVTEAWRVIFDSPISNDSSPGSEATTLTPSSPNPTQAISAVSLTVERSQNVNVAVLDVTGRRVQTLYDDGPLAAGAPVHLSLDASNLPAGVYIIRATGEDFHETQRVTVAH